MCPSFSLLKKRKELIYTPLRCLYWLGNDDRSFSGQKREKVPQRMDICMFCSSFSPSPPPTLLPLPALHLFLFPRIFSSQVSLPTGRIIHQNWNISSCALWFYRTRERREGEYIYFFKHILKFENRNKFVLNVTRVYILCTFRM